MKVIMLCGVIGSGKDHYANQYVKSHPKERVRIIRFASPLRNICARLFRFNVNDEAEYEKFKAENRQFMVDLGQSMKDEMGQDLFARAVADKIDEMDGEFDTILITDFRFPIEFWAIAERFNTFIVFCNYKSQRYAIRPEQVSEQMAIWLLEQGIQDGQMFAEVLFSDYVNKYEKSLNRRS